MSSLISEVMEEFSSSADGSLLSYDLTRALFLHPRSFLLHLEMFVGCVWILTMLFLWESPAGTWHKVCGSFKPWVMVPISIQGALLCVIPFLGFSKSVSYYCFFCDSFFALFFLRELKKFFLKYYWLKMIRVEKWIFRTRWLLNIQKRKECSSCFQNHMEVFWVEKQWHWFSVLQISSCCSFGKGIVVLIYLLGKILSQKTALLVQGFEVLCASLVPCVGYICCFVPYLYNSSWNFRSCCLDYSVYFKSPFPAHPELLGYRKGSWPF